MFSFKRLCLTLLFSFLLFSQFTSNSFADTNALYMDLSQPIEARVNDLLSRMTLEEKVSLVHADSAFTTAGVPRLGIPERYFSDGPLGVRETLVGGDYHTLGLGTDYSTAMPAGICLAATWDPEMAYAEGETIGEEARARGKDIMLGPAVNIYRTPLCGRNFEYFGEDPFLAGQIAVGYIHGEQSQDVSSCVKHFALNNQEHQRTSINVEADERTLREIYLPAFKAAVQQGGVWSVMGSYNKFRGQHCCENDYLLNQILKNEWGFKGLVMSDWGGTHDTREAALNGLDIEMGARRDNNYDKCYLGQSYLDGLKSGEFPMAGLHDKVRRNLRVMFATHVFDPGRTNGSLNTVAHEMVSRRAAEEGIVLLKNKGSLLPLNTSDIKTIAVIGDNAVLPQDNAGGSSRIKSFYEISPLQGIVNRAGQKVNIIFSQGYATNGGPDLADRAIAAAKAADVVIYVGGLLHEHYDSEGTDHKNYKLPYGQDELIQKIAAANPRTVVVLLGTPAEMDAWVDHVPAVLQAWYMGMEGGNALSAILFGDVNPGGKLPCSIAKRLEDSPAHAVGYYPGQDGAETYKEGLLVGYRWFDTKKIEPQFPFGYGLSYTTFKYSHLKLVKGDDSGRTIVTAQFDIENTGKVPGSEVAELYVHERKPELFRPEKELKGFKRVFLQPGQIQTVAIPLNETAFAYYNPDKKSWVAQKDRFQILVGGSSRDISLKENFSLPEPLTFN
ncbi:MAG TPA: glycoside hydrolase family 3 C-terminal domain-containing protein [Verrucomicrobiae bacterium]|jgi:beta-glucosidase|nr:glycoside hydrolase family 3 C-terminal domain-containing protein [Verrucomicrobiae bacterium]